MNRIAFSSKKGKVSVGLIDLARSEEPIVATHLPTTVKTLIVRYDSATITLYDPLLKQLFDDDALKTIAGEVKGDCYIKSAEVCALRDRRAMMIQPVSVELWKR